MGSQSIFPRQVYHIKPVYTPSEQPCNRQACMNRSHAHMCSSLLRWCASCACGAHCSKCTSTSLALQIDAESDEGIPAIESATLVIVLVSTLLFGGLTGKPRSCLGCIPPALSPCHCQFSAVHDSTPVLPCPSTAELRSTLQGPCCTCMDFTVSVIWMFTSWATRSGTQESRARTQRKLYVRSRAGCQTEPTRHGRTLMLPSCSPSLVAAGLPSPRSPAAESFSLQPALEITPAD